MDSSMEKNSIFTKKETIITIILLVIFIIVSFSLLGISISEYDKDCIPHNQCNKPAGEFAVQPGTTVLETINNCGENGYGEGNEPCVLRNIKNLTQAIQECNNRSDICNKFVYPDTDGSEVMRIVSLNGKIDSNITSHTYIRQVGVTFREN